MQSNCQKKELIGQNHNSNLHSKEPIHQYFVQSQHMSPSKRNSLKVDSVFSSHQKYDKFCPKLELLQMNLNRLYGQHETIKPLIRNFQQISTQLHKLNNIQTLKKNFQSLKIQYLISKTKIQAKTKIFFYKFKQRIEKLHADIQFAQNKFSNLIQTQNQKQKIQEENYQHQSSKSNFLKFKSLIENKRNFAFQFISNVQINLRQYYENASKDQINKYQLQIKQNELKKINLLKSKIGQLQCIVEYQKYLKNADKFEDKAKQLQNTNLTIEQKLIKIGQLQLSVFKDERKQIFSQNQQRIRYQINLILKKVKTLPERKEFMNTQNIITLKEQLRERITKIKYETKGIQQFAKNSYKKQTKLQAKLLRSTHQSLEQQLFHNMKICEDFLEQLSYLQNRINTN